MARAERYAGAHGGERSSVMNKYKRNVRCKAAGTCSKNSRKPHQLWSVSAEFSQESFSLSLKSTRENVIVPKHVRTASREFALLVALHRLALRFLSSVLPASQWQMQIRNAGC